MTNFLSVSLAFLLVLTARADEWKLMGNEHGIEIYHRQIEGSDVVALKGKGTVDAPVWKVASILVDTRRAPEWVDSLEESRVLKQLSPTHYIEFNHVGTPFIMKDRDFVSDVSIEIDSSEKSFSLRYRPGEDATAPQTGVRGEILDGTFRARSIEAEKRTELTAELHCDPKGAIPKWIVNLFQKSWPRNTFEAIRTQAAKADIAIPSEFKAALTPTLHF